MPGFPPFETNDYRLPNDGGITLAIPRRRRRPQHPKHQPPTPPPPTAADTKSNLKGIIQHCDDMIQLDKWDFRTISSPSIACFSKIKRDARNLLKPKTKTSKKDGAEAAADTTTGSSRWVKVHAQDTLVDQLKNCAYALMEYRIYQDYGDHCPAKNLDVVKTTQDVRDVLESDRWKADWTQVSKALKEEKAVFYRAGKRGEELPPLPWHVGIVKAVAILNTTMTVAQLICEIHEHAERSRVRRGVVDNFIVEEDWDGLAKKMRRDIRILDDVYPKTRWHEKEKMKMVMEEFKNHYFEICKMNPNCLTYIVPRMEPSGQDGGWESGQERGKREG